METDLAKNGKRALFGGAIGFASSVFGGGGGMIAVPLLRNIGLEEKGAHATAILLILPVAFLSFLLYAFKGIYDFSVLVPVAIGVTAGGLLGAVLLGKLPTQSVKILFAILQLIAGISMFVF